MNMVNELTELIQQIGPIRLYSFFAEFACAFEDGFFGEGFEEAEGAGEEGLVWIWFLEFSFSGFYLCGLGCGELRVAG